MTTMTRNAAEAPATERQVNFIYSLLNDREYPEQSRQNLTAALSNGEVSKGKASETIEWLLKQPKKAAATSAPKTTSGALPDVPAGRYAVEEDGVLKFWRVDRPEQGRWAGYTFLKIQASDDWYPVRDRARVAKIVGEIANDPQAASARYGHEIGACGICGRTLTDPESIERGIGPVCAGKLGW